MQSQENHRYRRAAADYLGRSLDDSSVIELAWQASQAADMAAFAVLRAGGRPEVTQIHGWDEDHAVKLPARRLGAVGHTD